MLQTLFARLEEIHPELVEFRRDMHMFPEISLKQIKINK